MKVTVHKTYDNNSHKERGFSGAFKATSPDATSFLKLNQESGMLASFTDRNVSAELGIAP